MSKKDFAFRRKRANPMTKHHKKKDIKGFLITTVIVAAVFSAIGALIYHPYFYIRNITATGLVRIDDDEFISAVHGIMNYRRFLVLPADNIFFAQPGKIEDILKSRYPIESIVVEKQYPQDMIITVEEQLTTIIYDDGKMYSYVDLQGDIVEKLRAVGADEWVTPPPTINTSTSSTIEEPPYHVPQFQSIEQEFGDYPIIYNKFSEEGSFKPQYVRSVIEWYRHITRKSDVPFRHVEIMDVHGNASIRTQEGWEVRVSLADDPRSLFDTFDHMVQQEIERPNLNYIDLRYPGRAYWK